jgi:hypothetical protein
MIKKTRGAAIVASLLLCASGAQATITLTVEGTVSSLDSEICSQSTGICSDTVTAIAPLSISYTASFANQFDEFDVYSHTTTQGDTIYDSQSAQSSIVDSSDYDHVPLVPALPAPNLTAEQFATGTDSSYQDVFGVSTGKTLKTHADGSAYASVEFAEIDASQNWSTTTADGTFLATSYGVEVDPFILNIAQSPGDVAVPISVDAMYAQMLKQFESGAIIDLDVTYDITNSTTDITEDDYYAGSGLMVSLTNDVSPVPEPAPLALQLAGLLAGGVLALRRRLRAARGARHS